MTDIVIKEITGLSEEFVAIHDKAQKGDLPSMEALSHLYFELGDKDKCFLWRDIHQMLLCQEIERCFDKSKYVLKINTDGEDYISGVFKQSQERVAKLKEYEKGIINGGKGFVIKAEVDETVAALIKNGRVKKSSVFKLDSDE